MSAMPGAESRESDDGSGAFSDEIDSFLREAARVPKLTPATDEPDRSGTTLSHFELVERIGAGGMGVVYAARDVRLGRTVAIKLLAADAVDDADRDGVLREARAAASVNHPNVAAVYDIGEDAGRRFIAMEFVEGRTLRELLRERETFDPEQAARVVAQVARGLGRAHQAGVIHRDIKPENVKITNDGTAKVLDFGLARPSAADPSRASGSIEESILHGRIAGTPGYMSPEQTDGGAIAPSSDVFSLGVVLYELLTGTNPFRGGGLTEILERTRTETVPRASSSSARSWPELDRVIERCLEKDPLRRPATGDELANAVESALAKRAARRRRRAGVVVVGLLAAAGGLVAAGSSRGGGAARAPSQPEAPVRADTAGAPTAPTLGAAPPAATLAAAGSPAGEAASPPSASAGEIRRPSRRYATTTGPRPPLASDLPRPEVDPLARQK